MVKREILFKGFRRLIGEWVVGHLIIEANGSAYIHNTDEDGTKRAFRVSNESVCQYTGYHVHAKDGEKIFDGDYDEEGNVVVWCDKCAGWNFGSVDLPSGEVYISCHNCEGDFMFHDHLPDFRPTGNIHDAKRA